ncbi:E3 ubiquitin-protein ligase rnf213-alpha [Silurus asotus]|uniref:E3 ubiquitin-protein ligase rnf213-alpha n=1 Tax=Silurus asotus TaxID=30991 RepID=A0AAD5AGA3_SILAS|nr:E3 ubiquitin-protein ligase rnf213-alpha [Silurus asotus]
MIEKKKELNHYLLGEKAEAFRRTIKEAEEDFKTIEKLKSKVKVLNDLNQGMPVDVKHLEATLSISLDKEERPLKTIIDMFSEEPGSDTHSFNIQAFEKIDVLYKSTYFKKLWRETTKQVKKTEYKESDVIPLDQVCDQIYKPAFEEYQNSFKALKDLSMSLQDLDRKLGNFSSSMSGELNTMADVFSEDKRKWIQKTTEHIERYRDVQSAKGNAEVVIELKNNLGLCGDFGGIENLRKDSCENMEWLRIAYETHGSVERSSLHQATDINRNGFYIIKSPPKAQTRFTLESCITLRCEEISNDGQAAEYRTYSLTELQELLNKLMLITVTVKNREDEITTYIEVLEQIINVGKCFLELHDAGHILFQDWEMIAYCKQTHPVQIWVKFGVTNVEIKGHRPMLVELKGLGESMRGCLSEWLKYTEQKRNTFYYLNYFTAKQLVYLCCSVATFQNEQKNISTGLLNTLSIIKDNIEESDLQDALTKALKTPVESGGSQGSIELNKFLSDYPETIEYFLQTGIPEEEIKAAIIYCEEVKVAEGYNDSNTIEDYQETVMQCIDDHQSDEEWVQEWCQKYEMRRDSVLKNQMKFKGGPLTEEVSFSMTEEQISAAFDNLENSDEKIVMLWKTYHNKLSGLVSDKFVDLDVLGETMNHLSNSAEVTIKRNLPFYLHAGKPNLISCKDAEMLPLCLSLYSDADQPLPSYDEILVCTSETTAEEVELLIRRAVQPGGRHEKLYCLLNADKLNHDVSRKLESIFYKTTQETHVQGGMCNSDYRLIIFCDMKAHHSYVATAFDMFKRIVSENPNRKEGIKQYLLHKHQTSSGAENGFAKLNQYDQFQLKSQLVFSEQAGMGKSLYVKNLVKLSEENLKSAGFTHTTIRIHQSQLRTEDIVSRLQNYEDKPMDKVPRIFHFDIPPVVTKGLYTFLLQLFVLRCFQSPDGIIWSPFGMKIQISAHVEEAFLEMLPTVKCFSPEETLRHLEQNKPYHKDCQLMDKTEFRSEAFQRTYQYFKIYRSKQNQLEGFSFIPGSVEDSPKEWLECLFHFCDIKNPSWGELRNFTHFLNSQLNKCEKSIFCSSALKEDLTGFKTFVVKFMMTMSKDFSMRSLKTSDDSDEKVEEAGSEDVALKEFQLRRRWEQQAHPYILFNADNESMTFLGFHIHNLNAVDARTKVIVEEKVINRTLFNQLNAQKVPFNINFEQMSRVDQLDILGRVLGVKIVEDPDDTYQLTLDNVMKILAIHLRFESDIPVVIMGETGCGKTRLVQFMCDLLRSGKQRRNLIVVRVHGGTTSEVIYKKVREAIGVSKENEVHKLDTVLFFDEANTTEAVNAIKEVMCDKSVNGEQINAPHLKIIAACNPYRKHSKEAIEQLERAGLGYRVRSENTEEKLGQIPMRQLVYRVQPLPPSLTPLVWDFGNLNEHTQELYITQMVKTFFHKEKLCVKHQDLFTKVISASQKHMAELTDECRMVSLRDIERCLKTVMWFYQQRQRLFQEIDSKRENNESIDNPPVEPLVRSLILAIGVCYLASLENRDEYLARVSEAFSLPRGDILTEIELCKEAFISNVDCPSTVAKNNALKENVFMMVVCMNLRIPLFLVGKPGSSKSLSKTIAAHAMQGKASPKDLFKGYKQAQLASFQCSPHSSPDGIISIFRQCAQFQKSKHLDEYVAVVVLDEIGLAEDSPKMPLKTLHPLLEYGCIDDENPEAFKKVGFIGISNWSLDPAKMNRGILVLRTSPLEKELEKTARDICSSDNEPINEEIGYLIPKLTEFYLKLLKEQKSEFFGLRDFYSLVKLIMSYALEANGRPSDEALTRAVQRNFDGLDSLNALEIFWEIYQGRTKTCDTVSLLKENLHIGTSGFTSRYLLLPTINHAAIQILKSQNIIDISNVEIIFGSGFPHDEEYSQVCRTVNRIKTCMETGRSVVLFNIQSLYESLYDALNQCYVKLGGNYYVDLGLGSHRVKCRVKDEFRLIVIEEKSTVYEQFPTPLLNRLEKHCLEMNNILPEHARQMQAELEEWLNMFVAQDSTKSDQLLTNKKKYDTIVGYTEDTCACVLLQCCPQLVSQELDHDEREEVLQTAKEMLLQCATPDSVLRAPKYMEEKAKEFLEVYFSKQPHGSFIQALKQYRDHNPDGFCLQVSTYSQLLNKKDVEKITKELKITERDSCLFLLNEFYTEQSFTQAVSEFLSNDTGAYKLLLLQSYFNDAKQSQRLLFCVRHSIARIRSSLSDGWISLHMDELIVTPGFSGDIYELQHKTVSETFKKSLFTATENPDTDDFKMPISKRQDVLVDTHLLMKKSLQKGILQLRDKEDNNKRATKRVEILHGLLRNKYTEDSLVTCHAENAETLITKIRHLWKSTWIIYLLMDHLLQNEQEMEKKLLTFLTRNLIFAWKKLNSEEGSEMESVIDHVIGTLTKCSRNACNVFKVVCGYCDEDFTENNTAEVECGHMFHISCLKEHNDEQCRTCKKPISRDYKPCGVIAKETFLKVNRFRRKCNSFFVEFMWKFISSKEQLTDNVLNKLLDYVNCKPYKEGTSEKSTLQRMKETAPQLQRFVEEAVKSKERNTDEIYFMVVRSIEDISTQSVDHFQMYKEMYNKITVDSFKALEDPSHEIAEEFAESTQCFRVCMALAAVRQATHNTTSANNAGSLDFYIPTMPNSVNEIQDWVKNWTSGDSVNSNGPVDNVKIWACKCGEPVLIANDVQNLTEMPQGAHDVRKHLLHHLQKDLEMLGKTLGKSQQDAEMTVHLFLKYILESSSESNPPLQLTDSEDKRTEWENAVQQRLQAFFQNYEAQLEDAQRYILKMSGMDTLAQIIYSKTPAVENLPTSGVFNIPLMWNFEQRMTIQRFSHLIEQKDEEMKSVPVLSQLLKKHADIRHIQYLPQVLSLQQKLMCYFENLDPQCFNNVPINAFREDHVADYEQQAFTESAEIMKLLWKYLKAINYIHVPEELKQKDENDLTIVDLLPMERSVARIITKYLVQMQNNLIEITNPTDRKISANELKPSHVITCVPDQDFLTIAISNIDHVVQEDGKHITNYHFKTVERQIIDRYFTEKPMIQDDTLPLFKYDSGTTMRAFFRKVQDKLVLKSSQNPFIMIEDQDFHEMFTDQINEMKTILTNITNLDVLITELHYVILNIALKDVRPDWKIIEAFEAFQDHAPMQVP